MYEFIEELHQLKEGRYIKWLKLEDKKWRGGFILKVDMYLIN